MAARRVLMVAVLVLLAGLVIVPVAGATTAVKASVRVEATAFRIAPTTAVLVPESGTIVDSVGNTYPYTKANALAAFDRAADLRGFSYETLTYGGEPYVSSILSETSWMYAVNGAGWPNIDVGAFSFEVLPGDSVVFYQSPVFTADTSLLDARLSAGPALNPGQDLTVSVFADDLKAPNSATDATRFGVEPTTVVTPDAFPAETGVIVHVGGREYFDGAFGDAPDGAVAVKGLPRGTYAVWAEKISTDAVLYVRSPIKRINVGVAPVLSRVVARPNPFSPGVDPVRVAFDLSKAAKVKMTVRTRAGVLLRTITATKSAGRGVIRWDGRTSTGRLVGRGVYSLRLTATDPWGRVSKGVTTAVTAR